VYVAASAAAYLCDGVGSAYDVASQTASAYAEALAYAAAQCVLVGDSSAKAYASAQAKAKAEIWVSADFEAYAEATNCETCQSWAYSWGYVSKHVLLEAVAEVEVKVCNASYPTKQ
jgi:hypothetical protein